MKVEVRTTCIALGLLLLCMPAWGSVRLCKLLAPWRLMAPLLCCTLACHLGFPLIGHRPARTIPAPFCPVL